jgi:hypothetical protein
MNKTALRELPPKDWRIPTDEEWIELLVSLGMKSNVRGLLNETETSLEVWRQLLEGPFKGRLGGVRDKNGNFIGIGERALWAAAGAHDTTYVGGYYRPDERDASMTIAGTPNPFFVRCVRDKPMSEHQKAVKNAMVEFVHEGAYFKIARDNIIFETYPGTAGLWVTDKVYVAYMPWAKGNQWFVLQFEVDQGTRKVQVGNGSVDARPNSKADIEVSTEVEWDGTLPSGIPYDPAWDLD